MKVETVWYLYAKEWTLIDTSYHIYEHKLKMDQSLAYNIKILEKNDKILWTWFRQKILIYKTKAWAIKQVYKFDFPIKIIWRETKRQTTKRKYLQITYFIKFVSRIFREQFSNLNDKKK